MIRVSGWRGAGGGSWWVVGNQTCGEGDGWMDGALKTGSAASHVVRLEGL